MGNEILENVKAHALKNYDNGWDVIVECYSDEELLELIGRCRSTASAIKKVAAFVGLWNEKKEDIEKTAF